MASPTSHHDLPDRFSSAAPWWIAIGIIGVSMAVLTGKAPLLASLTLIGMGSDADIGRRLREALAAEGDRALPTDPAMVAALVRRVHAAMYAVLLLFAWASLLHLTSQDPNGGDARWWLAADVAASAAMVFGYARMARRHS